MHLSSGRIIVLCGLLLPAGCQRTPQTAAELAKRLPAEFAGELHLQGDSTARHIRIGPRELSIRGEHLLEFNRVDYELGAGTSVPEQVALRGTITVPGLQIHLEMLGGNAGGDDAIRLETFTGTLSQDLRTLRADWFTGLGQKASLTLRAE